LALCPAAENAIAQRRDSGFFDMELAFEFFFASSEISSEFFEPRIEAIFDTALYPGFEQITPGEDGNNTLMPPGHDGRLADMR